MSKATRVNFAFAYASLECKNVAFDEACQSKKMALLHPTFDNPTPRTKLLSEGSNKRVPSPSTVSITELTRWITVTTEACGK